MKHICMFSGGAASSYMSFLIARQFPHDTILLHTPAGAEHPDADRFRAEIAAYIGLPITVASCGMDLWAVIRKNRMLPDFRPFCTRILKWEPRHNFLRDIKQDHKVYVGFGPNEFHRIEKARANGGNDEYPLFDRGTSSEKCKDIIKNEWKICLPEPYKTMRHNNCLPCFKGGEGHFKAVWQNYPENFQKAVDAEEFTGHTVFQGKPLKKLVEKWEKEPKQETFFEIEKPCMCAD